MKVELFNLDKKVVGDISLPTQIFGLDARVDLIKRVIDWQLAKRMSGNHRAKTVGEVSGTTKKPFKQKGTGNARQGNARGVQRRGGGVAHGPVVRSHAFSIPKKVRALALKHSLSAKLKEGNLFVVDSFDCDQVKTSILSKKISNFSQDKCFMIKDKENNNFDLSVSSIDKVRVAPVIGANVYDIVNSSCVLISKSAIESLSIRLKVE
ncbi:MAG TPA: 50S ribosomal protein L4 [Candidatus Megaira endosymbiont of Hartmannula sinica]|nr:50S ribosomal protein L4 [Candidatus Megaera endosymbiont of Hartmannula sinica]